MSAVSILFAIAGFFMAGYYYCRWKTLDRLRKFIGKGNLDYMTVLKIVANDLEQP